MIPAPEASQAAAVDQLSRQLFVNHRVVPALVPGACLDLGLLERFGALMGSQGEPTQPQRMRYDRRYALERLARAHCSGDPMLRRLALLLFELYQDEAGER